MASRAGKFMPETSEEKALAREHLVWKHMARTRADRDSGIHPNRHIHDDVEELLGLGFSKRMIAGLLNVNLTEVLRWQSTATCRPDEEKKLLELLALCDMLQVKYGIADPAAWFETWLVPTCVIDMQEIYYNGRFDLVLGFAARRKTAEQVLDIYDPAWRDVPPSMWEVATHPDGETYIRMRGDGDG